MRLARTHSGERVAHEWDRVENATVLTDHRLSSRIQGTFVPSSISDSKRKNPSGILCSFSISVSAACSLLLRSHLVMFANPASSKEKRNIFSS